MQALMTEVNVVVSDLERDLKMERSVVEDSKGVIGKASSSMGSRKSLRDEGGSMSSMTS